MYIVYVHIYTVDICTYICCNGHHLLLLLQWKVVVLQFVDSVKKGLSAYTY